MDNHRLAVLASQFSSRGNGDIADKSAEDIVIVGAVRTPLSRARKGPFKDLLPEDLLCTALKGLITRSGLAPELVDDIIVGNVLPAGGGATVARMAALAAGIPEKTSIATVNRQCSSGLQAAASIASSIASGYINVGIAAGVESMTHNYGPSSMPSSISEVVSNSCKAAADCLLPMGITSENVAAAFNVSREKQDLFAVASHKKAAAAAKEGRFKEEIVPVTLANGTTVASDDGIREDSSMETLSKLKPAFSDNGTTTAGNSSQVTDGAAAVLMMKRSTAQSLGLPVLAKWVSFATVGVPPGIMGIGPAYAIPKALEKAGLKLSDVDIFELNEAFASQAVACIEKLGIDMKKVNPNGGAIALGHPLGATGARQIATLLPELKRTNGKFGVITMCVGTGMGAAAVIQRE